MVNIDTAMAEAAMTEAAMPDPARLDQAERTATQMRQATAAILLRLPTHWRPDRIG